MKRNESFDEYIDFGCEERSADDPVIAIVTLLDENGEQLRSRQEDQMLYDRNINEGDLVVLDQKRCLRKTG